MDNQEQFLPAMVSRSQGAVRDEVRGGATGGRGCHAHGRGRRTRVPSDPDVGATEATRTTWTRPAVQVLKEVVGMALMDQFKEAIRQVRVDTEEGEVELPELASYHLELLLLSSMQHLRRNMK